MFPRFPDQNLENQLTLLLNLPTLLRVISLLLTRYVFRFPKFPKSRLTERDYCETASTPVLESQLTR